MATEPALPDKVVAIHEALVAGRVAHAFGGALALAYYAEPRATVDIDLNVFLAPSRLDELRQHLGPLGVTGEADAVERDGQCRLWWGRTPLDLFFAYDAIHDAMRRALRRVPFGAATLPILAPEHLAVCKAMFDRTKDWLDIEQMLLCTEHLDPREVEDWLVALLGEGDQRGERFGRLARDLRG